MYNKLDGESGHTEGGKLRLEIITKNDAYAMRVALSALDDMALPYGPLP